jgi:hypothetical protein
MTLDDVAGQRAMATPPRVSQSLIDHGGSPSLEFDAFSPGLLPARSGGRDFAVTASFGTVGPSKGVLNPGAGGDPATEGGETITTAGVPLAAGCASGGLGCPYYHWISIRRRGVSVMDRSGLLAAFALLAAVAG